MWIENNDDRKQTNKTHPAKGKITSSLSVQIFHVVIQRLLQTLKNASLTNKLHAVVPLLLLTFSKQCRHRPFSFPVAFISTCHLLVIV